MTNLDLEYPIRHGVYRIYDEADRLLYIGCAQHPDDRIHTFHYPIYSRIEASWDMAGLIHHWTVEEYPNKVEARQAEREAIKAEHPFFNKLHNKGHRIDGDEYDRRWPDMRTQPFRPRNVLAEKAALEADRECAEAISEVFQQAGIGDA